MRRLPAIVFCLLLLCSILSQAAAPASGSVTITVPLVPRPINPPLPEYLLTPPVSPGSGPAWRTAQETTLREAMFRYLFMSFPPDAEWQPKVYYLAVQAPPWEHDAAESKDPDAALLERFHSSKWPVKGVSALLRDKSWNEQARHHWTIYCVSSFRWVNDTSVVIYSERSFPHSFQGDSIFLTCTLRNGWWEITGTMEVSA